MAARQGLEYGPTGKAATGGAAGGGSVGLALVEILVHFFPSLEPIGTPLNFILGVGLAALAAAFAAKYTPSSSVRREQEKAAQEWENTEGRGAPTPVAAAPVTAPEDAETPLASESRVHVTGSDAYGDLDRLAGGGGSTRA